jgi:hypothetical protein
MPKRTWIKVSGTWKEVSSIWRKTSGVWQNNVMSFIKSGGVWKECMSYLPNITSWGGFQYISDGTATNPIYPQIEYVNDGGAGTLSLEWEMYDSGDALINSDSTSVDVITQGGYAEPWINYPYYAGNGFYLKARIYSGGAWSSWTTSNSFSTY